MICEATRTTVRATYSPADPGVMTSDVYQNLADGSVFKDGLNLLTLKSECNFIT
jgi:hypothetical protein